MSMDEENPIAHLESEVAIAQFTKALHEHFAGCVE